MSGGHGPRTLEEMHEEEQVTAAEKLNEGIKGFYLTDPFNTEIEDLRKNNREHFLELLNVSSKTAEKIEEGGKKIHEVIIDARVTEQLRQRLKQHQKEKKSWRSFVPGTEAWKFNRETVKDLYGDASNVKKMQNSLLNKVLDGLSNPDNQHLWLLLTQTPPPPTTVDKATLIDLLTTASPVHLLDVVEDFSIISPSRERTDNFKHFAEVQDVLAQNRAKVFSPFIFSPNKLHADVTHSLEHSTDPTDQAILDKLKNLLGSHIDHGLEHDHKLRALFAELRFKRQTDATALNDDLDKILTAYPVKDRTVVERELSDTEKQNNSKLDEHLGKINEAAKRLHEKDAEKMEVDSSLKEIINKKAEVKKTKDEKVNKINDAQTKIETARTVRTNVIKEIDALGADIHKEERTLNNLKSEEESLNKRLRDTRTKIPSLNDEEKKLEKKVEEAKRKKLDSEVVSLEAMLQGIKDKKAALNDEIVDLEKRLGENDKAKTKSITDIDNLREQLKIKNGNKTDADHELEKYERERREVETKEEYSHIKTKEIELDTQEKELTTRQKNLVKEIEEAKNEFNNSSNIFVRFIEVTMKKEIKGTKDTHDEKIKLFKDSISAADVDRTFIKNLMTNIPFKNQFDEEINMLKAVGTKVVNITADHLLLELKKKDVEKLGKFHDEGQILKVARMATSFAQIDAKNVELFRAGNRMIAESKIGGLKGVWNKSKQQVASTFFNSDTFRARDVIEHIAGLDHAFEVFKDLPIDASLADIRRAIKHHGGMSTENLMKVYLRLQDAVKGFTVGHGRNVKIADRDFAIEQVALFAEKIYAELEAREFCHKIEHPESEEDKKLQKSKPAEYFQKMLNQRDESQKKLEAAHLEQLRNPNELWQISFLHSLMKEKYSKAYEEALAEGKKQGWSKKRLMEYLQHEKSVPRTIVKHLMTGLAIKEGWDVITGFPKWIGKLFGASKKAGEVGTTKGAGLVGRAWRGLGSGIKKGGSAVGRGVGRGIRGTADFFVGKPLRFFFKEPPKMDKQGNVVKGARWSIFKQPKNIAKAMWWPFGLVGRGTKGFFNFFHYTPEKAAADQARYAAKMAGKAHAGGGGHGAGGGHGGGH